MDARIEVRVGDCTCPDGPHPDGDVIYLAPKPSLRLGLAAERILIEAGTAGTEATTDALMEAFVSHGAVGWNLEYINGKGRPEPKPFAVADILADWSVARLVAEKANDLYADIILRPFLEALARPSPTGQTDATTSPATTSTRSRRKRSSATTSAGVP
jgi:hypothetical protein